MQAKQRLAELIVARYHGSDAAAGARQEFTQRFSEKEFPEEPDARVTLTAADVADPTAPAIGLVDLVARTKLVPSKSEARRLIVQGGVEMDEQKQTDPNAAIRLVAGRPYRFRIGRRKFAIVEYKAEG
jgi:tyrosyl-tRNA synthetase